MRQVEPEALLGRTLGAGEYRLVARLGAGGMGAVYEAEQTGLARRVAIKVLWPHLTQESGLAGRFNREARIAARLEHPHILPVYGFGQEGGLLYLVLRLVRGGSLKDRLRGEGRRRAGWSPGEALELARQVLPALDYAHRQGVVHRDLKPDNILVEPSDDFAAGYRVFVSDFGIATVIHGDEVDSGLTQTGAALGTPAYIAPEQVLDQPVDGRADLYAFGVVLFEVLVGQVPYRAHTPLAVAMQHVRDPVPAPRELNPRLPTALEPVLLRALAKDREDRFPTGAALVAALAQAVESTRPERPVSSTPGKPDSTGSSANSVERASASIAARARLSSAAEEQSAQNPEADEPQPEEPHIERPWPTWPALLLAAASALLVLALTALALTGNLTANLPAAGFGLAEPARPTLDAGPVPLANRAAPADPRPWAVGPADLGPDWTASRESTAGSTAQLSVYEVEYTSPAQAQASRGFSLFSAPSAVDAEAGLQQLRQSAEARGVVFESSAALGAGRPALRGTATLAGDSPRLSIVFVFRVNTVAAVVETIGPADQQTSLNTTATRDAQLQRDRLLAGINQ